MITIRKTGNLDLDHIEAAWDRDPALAVHGVAVLLHSLLGHVVDGHLEAVQQVDEALEMIEADLFTETSHTTEVQMRSYAIRKAMVDLRRVALPMREVLTTFTRRDLHVVDAQMQPYFADVHDNVLRVVEQTDSLRDLVGTIQDSNLQLQSNRTNEVMRRLSAFAAIFAASTAITGFYGMNVLFPQTQSSGGAVTASVILVVSTIVLIAFFRHRKWM